MTHCSQGAGGRGACHTNLQRMTRTFGAGACNRDRFPLGSSLDSPIWNLPGRFSRSIFQVIARKVPYIITMTDHIVLLRVNPLSLFLKH